MLPNGISLLRAGLSSNNIGVEVQRFRLFSRLFDYFSGYIISTFFDCTIL